MRSRGLLLFSLIAKVQNNPKCIYESLNYWKATVDTHFLLNKGEITVIQRNISAVVLTHRGQALSEIQKFDRGEHSDDDEIGGDLGADIVRFENPGIYDEILFQVRVAHFGGGEMVNGDPEKANQKLSRQSKNKKRSHISSFQKRPDPGNRGEIKESQIR